MTKFEKEVLFKSSLKEQKYLEAVEPYRDLHEGLRRTAEMYRGASRCLMDFIAAVGLSYEYEKYVQENNSMEER